jgi:hypothetical protein
MNRSLTTWYARLSSLVLLFILPSLTHAEDPAGDRVAQLQNLVVVVRAHVDNEDTIGTGIIFGASSTRFYIVTANHTVRMGASAADAVSVQVKWLPGQRLKATLLDNADAGLDLAVLSVQAAESSPILHYDVLGSAAAVQEGDDVYTLGHPNGNLWQMNVKPDAVSSKKLNSIYFQSNFIAPGDSGGALLDKDRRLIGMILSDQPPHGEARSVDRVIEWLQQFDYPLALSSPGDPGNLAQFEASIRVDVAYNCAALSAWPNPDSKPAVRQDSLFPVLKKVESEPRYRSAKSPIIADLYRCIGGAYFVMEGEIWDKVPKALPYLRHSIENNPAQPLLKENIAYFETFMQKHEGNIAEYMTNALEVLKGKDPNIASIVRQFKTEVASPEFQAKQWLLHDATANPPLQQWLDIVSIRIKRETNVDAPVEVTSSALPNGMVAVQAKVGPNVFLWDVDYKNRKYFSKNKLTEDYMSIVEKPQH